MLILALDTATEAVAAAVLDAATGTVVGREVTLGPTAHGERLAPVVEAALAQAGITPRQLGAVGVGRGPGPFTGLRVGLVHAAVLGWALGIPVHGVCTLDVLARQAVAEGLEGPFLVATDARRREVFWARYDRSGARIAGPAVGPAAGIPDRAVPVVGLGAQRYPEALPDGRPPLHPDPGHLARMVAGAIAAGAPADTSPLYLRRPDATVAGARKRVTQP